MKKVLKNMTSNWFVFFGYLSLFLLTVIAALQIYDANHKIANKYKDFANKATSKLNLLLKTRENLGSIQSITTDKVFYPMQETPALDIKLADLTKENDNNLARYQQMCEQGIETEAFQKLLQAWELNKKDNEEFTGLQSDGERASRFYQSTQKKNYEDLKNAVASLSQVLRNKIQVEERAADSYFQKSIVFIDILIGIRVMILIIIGIIIFNGVARLRIKNKILQATKTELLQNQAHLLASQRISKTGSWELHLSESGEIIKNTLAWSDETFRIFGYQPGEVKVSNELFFSHVPEHDRARIMNAVQRSIETGIPYDIEHKLVLRNGETKVVYERSDIVYGADGKPEKMIGTCQDITARKLSEQKLAESEKEKQRLKDQINKQKITRQKEITRATIKAQEKERFELGRELHDNVNQILSTSKLFIENSAHNPDKREEMLSRSASLINASIEELRRLSRFLAPPSLGDLTLRESIEEIVEEYNQVDGKKIIEYAITDLDEDRLSDDLKISVYRIIQEQLNNIRKYAQASQVKIWLKHGVNNISLQIEDNGAGFDLHAKRKGLGFTNIINRAETFNGDVQIVSSPGKGCSLQVNFRLNRTSVVNISKKGADPEQTFYGTGS